MQHKSGIVKLLRRMDAATNEPPTPSHDRVEEFILRRLFGTAYDVIVAPLRAKRD
jgi:hypothetical protein